MKLDMQQIYIDYRFRSRGNKSESDFSIELPRSFNVPDGVIPHIDDIGIPVSWRTIDEMNHKCYIAFSVGGALREANFTFDSKNYDVAMFATALAAKLTTAVAGFVVVPKSATVPFRHGMACQECDESPRLKSFLGPHPRGGVPCCPGSL